MSTQFQSDKAYKEIRKRILTQYYPTGSVLSVSDLSKNMKMSRTPVNVALRQLEADGLIQFIPRKGIIVRTFSKEDFFDCIEAIEALEGMSVYLITRGYARGDIGEGLIDKMNDVISELDKYEAENNIPMWHEGDIQFHDIFVDFCPNNIIKKTLKDVRNQMLIGFGFFAPLYLNKDMASKDHRDIVEAIKEGDSVNARDMAQQHRHNARINLRKLLQTNNNI
ncbi:MAG: GntR family transcriptional regulator [Clostridiales Family XIII bacterium]|jgi:DNA-binding GntR family transcriptional regulator|nr:GntR family transcriptional regulator [Clostridiales Family XIII bacterium]